MATRIIFTNRYLSLLSTIITLNVFVQITYTIDGFSKKYHAKLTVEKGYEDEVFKKGSIILYGSKSKKELIKIESEELTFELDNNGERLKPI